jgi:hypothetical protein
MSLTHRLTRAAAAATIALGALTALAAPAEAAPSATAHLSPLTSPVTSRTIAGYAVAGERVTNVATTFNLPNISSCTVDGSYADPIIAADIDGFGDNVSEQAGYEYNCQAGGWRGVASCYPVPCDGPLPNLPVPAPGDLVSVTLINVSSDNFTATFSDLTRGWTGTTAFQDPSAQLASGAVIVEDATTSGGSPLPLPSFSPVAFRSSTVDGATLSSGDSTPLVMVSPAGQVMAQPSAVSGGAFTVQWYSSGP